MNIDKTTTFQSLLVALSAFVTLAASASAVSASYSPEQFTEYGPEMAYWVVKVKCDNIDEQRVIQRKTDGDNWCSKDLSSSCSATKSAMVKKVCSKEVTESLASAKRVENQRLLEEKTRQEQARKTQPKVSLKPVSSSNAVSQNKISIEEKLLKIEQEKLSLRRQELELQRRAVEILDELQTL